MSASSCGTRLAWVMAAGAVLLLTTACTSTSSITVTNTRAAPSQIAASTLARGPKTAVEVTLQLSCADAGSGTSPDGASTATGVGLVLQGVDHAVEGVKPGDVGLQVSGDRTLYFFKAPAWLPAATGATTIELPPHSTGYLAWVPAQVWTGARDAGGGKIDLTPWTASKLVLRGCPDRDSTFFGGLLSTDPYMCLTLTVAGPTGQPRQIKVGSIKQCT